MFSYPKIAPYLLSKKPYIMAPRRLEGAATWAGLTQLLDQQTIRDKETVVLFNTCHAAKYWPWTSKYPIKTLKNYEDFKAINS